MLQGVKHLLFSLAMKRGTSKKYIGARISAQTKTKLEQIAKSQDRSLNYIVELFLAQGVKHLK